MRLAVEVVRRAASRPGGRARCCRAGRRRAPTARHRGSAAAHAAGVSSMPAIDPSASGSRPNRARTAARHPVVIGRLPAHRVRGRRRPSAHATCRARRPAPTASIASGRTNAPRRRRLPRSLLPVPSVRFLSPPAPQPAAGSQRDRAPPCRLEPARRAAAAGPASLVAAQAAAAAGPGVPHAGAPRDRAPEGP